MTQFSDYKSKSHQAYLDDIRKLFCPCTCTDECQEKVTVVINESDIQQTAQNSHQTEALQKSVSNRYYLPVGKVIFVF